jgi:hypothetical protein
MEEMNTIQPVKQERPSILTTFLILTCIWSGLMTLLSLIGILASGTISGLIDNAVPGLGALSGTYIIIVFIISFVLWGMSLFGAIKMFSLKKSGFILYIIPNGLMLIFQLIGIATAFTLGSFFYLIVSILFIYIYAKHLKIMS